jgi:osmotically inducible protein OsmC
MAIDRTAHVTWEGDLRSGSGRYDLTSSGAVSGGEVTFTSRFEPESGGRTSPEELIAAAHATCFSMALANGLAQDGHAPARLETDTKVTLDNSGGGFAISKIQLTVRGRVEGLDEAEFRKAAEQAKANCPVSKALAAVPEIALDARLL